MILPNPRKKGTGGFTVLHRPFFYEKNWLIFNPTVVKQARMESPSAIFLQWKFRGRRSFNERLAQCGDHEIAQFNGLVISADEYDWDDVWLSGRLSYLFHLALYRACIWTRCFRRTCFQQKRVADFYEKKKITSIEFVMILKRGLKKKTRILKFLEKKKVVSSQTLPKGSWPWQCLRGVMARIILGKESEPITPSTKIWMQVQLISNRNGRSFRSGLKAVFLSNGLYKSGAFSLWGIGNTMHKDQEVKITFWSGSTRWEFIQMHLEGCRFHFKDGKTQIKLLTVMKGIIVYSESRFRTWRIILDPQLGVDGC